MSGLFRRNRGPRAAADASPEHRLDEGPDAPAGVPEHDSSLPAGADPEELREGRPSTRRRGRLRKRLRHLRRSRELLLRDLGGLVYEVHRAGTQSGDPDRLVGEKVTRLQLLDAEVRDLEERLDDRTGELLLREPGIGGFCPSCGELFGSEARFCSNCGAPLARSADRAPAPADEEPPAEAAPPEAGAPRTDEQPTVQAARVEAEQK